MFHWRKRQPPAFWQNYTSLWCLCNLFIIDAINERLYDTFHGSLCMMGLWLKPATLDMPVKKNILHAFVLNWLEAAKMTTVYILPNSAAWSMLDFNSTIAKHRKYFFISISPNHCNQTVFFTFYCGTVPNSNYISPTKQIIRFKKTLAILSVRISI